MDGCYNAIQDGDSKLESIIAMAPGQGAVQKRQDDFCLHRSSSVSKRKQSSAIKPGEGWGPRGGKSGAFAIGLEF
jgi:hypothetical protein